MKRYAVHILTITCLLLALVTSTLAWMLGNQDTKLVGTFGVDFDGSDDGNTLTVVSQELSFEVLVQDTEGQYEPFNTYTFDEAIPGKIIPFEIRFYNNADRVITIDLSISGIRSYDGEGKQVIEDGKTLIHHTFVSLMADGDFLSGIASVEEYRCLGDGLDGALGESGHSIVVVPNMQIPVPAPAADGEKEPYVMHCYFLVDGSVDSVFQDVRLEIGSFLASIH